MILQIPLVWGILLLLFMFMVVTGLISLDRSLKRQTEYMEKMLQKLDSPPLPPPSREKE